MALWWFLFFCNLLYPLCMIAGGWLMEKICVKKIHYLGGYRSRRSMCNIDTWRFANEDCGRRWRKIGLLLLLPTILVQIPFYRASEDVVGWLSMGISVVGCTILLLSILPTERALKETFTEDGRRKQ